MDVVVIGATGNVGTALLDALALDPVVTTVRAVARREPERSWAKTTFIRADVTTDDLGPAVRGADAVVHLAWIFQPTHQPTATWQVNVGGTSRVLDAVAKEGVSTLVCSSSVGAYSPAPGREVDESWPTDGLPTAAYGREKAYVERMLDALEARRPEIRVARIRSGFVFQRSSGTQQLRLFAGPFVPTWLLRLLRPGTLPFLPFPQGMRFQCVHAPDLAEAYHLALTNPTARGAYNVAADPVVDGTVVASVLGTRVVPVPRWLVRSALAAAWRARLSPADPALFDLAAGLPLMRTDRVRAELAWSPATAADDALREGLAGMAEGAGGDTPPLRSASHSGTSRPRTP